MKPTPPTEERIDPRIPEPASRIKCPIVLGPNGPRGGGNGAMFADDRALVLVEDTLRRERAAKGWDTGPEAIAKCVRDLLNLYEEGYGTWLLKPDGVGYAFLAIFPDGALDLLMAHPDTLSLMKGQEL